MGRKEVIIALSEAIVHYRAWATGIFILHFELLPSVNDILVK